jgi:hypothetical protein
MEQIKSQIEFLQWLYLIKGTVNSIAERAEFWIKDNGGAIPFSHRLMKSPLALRTARDLIYWMWDIAGTLEGYVDDNHREAFRKLQALYARNVEERRQDMGGGIFAPEFRARGLEALQQAAQTLYEIADAAFEESFLELPWPGDEWNLDFINRDLRLINGKLEDKLFWLGAILEDLGKVMAQDGISPAVKAPRQKRTTSIRGEQKGTRARA